MRMRKGFRGGGGGGAISAPVCSTDQIFVRAPPGIKEERNGASGCAQAPATVLSNFKDRKNNFS